MLRHNLRFQIRAYSYFGDCSTQGQAQPFFEPLSLELIKIFDWHQLFWQFQFQW